jgi:PKD repeat protein
MSVGPDGMLYYLSFTTGEVRRVRYNGPVAQAAATPKYGYSPLSVSFSSAGSVNPGGGSLTYLWDFGDGVTSTAANPSHTYTSSTVKTFAATLTVTNSSGLSSTSPASVTVGSAPPTPTIDLPADGTTVRPGQTINYHGSATDPEDGNLSGSALQWTVLVHHNTHVHTFVGGTGSSGSFVAENHGPIGTFSYEVILTATDTSGLKANTSLNIPVVTDTSPPSAPTGFTAAAAPAATSDHTSPTVSMTLPKQLSLGSIIARGLRIRVACSEPCMIKAELQLSRAVARSLGLRTPGSRSMVVIGRGAGALHASGRASITVKLTAKARRALRRLRQGRLTVRITATDAAGNAKRVTASIKPKIR